MKGARRARSLFEALSTRFTGSVPLVCQISLDDPEKSTEGGQLHANRVKVSETLLVGSLCLSLPFLLDGHENGTTESNSVYPSDHQDLVALLGSALAKANVSHRRPSLLARSQRGVVTEDLLGDVLGEPNPKFLSIGPADNPQANRLGRTLSGVIKVICSSPRTIVLPSG